MNGEEHILFKGGLLQGADGRSFHHVIALAVARVSGVVANAQVEGVHIFVKDPGQLRTGDTGLGRRRHCFLGAPGNVKEAEPGDDDGVL